MVGVELITHAEHQAPSVRLFDSTRASKLLKLPVWNSCSLDALRSLSAYFPRTTLRVKSRFRPAPPISAHAVQSLWFVLVESPATVLAYLVGVKLHPCLYLPQFLRVQRVDQGSF